MCGARKSLPLYTSNDTPDNAQSSPDCLAQVPDEDVFVTELRMKMALLAAPYESSPPASSNPYTQFIQFLDAKGSGVKLDDRRLQSANAKTLRKVDQFDASQTAALQNALTNRVALIQGPPGTGKTHIGVILAQTIHATTDFTILCVCYTNHALDSFLEALLDEGITSVVRVGGRSKNERVKEYSLFEQSVTRAPFSVVQNRRYAQLCGEIEDAESQIARLERQCSYRCEMVGQSLRPP